MHIHIAKAHTNTLISNNANNNSPVLTRYSQAGMDTNYRGGEQRKTWKRDSHRERQRKRKDGKKKAIFPAGMAQKQHAVFNRYPDSERHRESG